MNKLEIAIAILKRRGFGLAASDLEMEKKRLEYLLQINQFLVNHKDEFAPEPDSALATAIDNIKTILEKLGR